MFQSFDTHSSPQKSAERILELRQQMKKRGLNWFLVPHADEHQNEYLPKRAERLSWLTGFTGSAGFAIIGLDQAHIFVDGRYTAQIRTQADLNVFTPQDLVGTPPSAFIANVATSGETIGYDPMLITIAGLVKWQEAAKKCRTNLMPIENIIDEIWTDQPAAPMEQVFIHSEKYAGESTSSKISKIRNILENDKVDALLLTDPASLAWAFNIRGSDVEHNPLALGFAIIPTSEKEKPFLFIDRQKLNEEVESALQKLCTLKQPIGLEKEIAKQADGGIIHCDPNLVASAFGEIIENAKGKIVKKRDPIVLLRALKNETEIQGSRDAHLRDGVACTRFLHWLDTQEAGSVDEISAVKQLEDLRRKTAKTFGSSLKEISFDTISGAGSNGAIVHYRVTQETNKTLENNSLYLVDSGAQYVDGTTDITRTVAIGTPPDEAITDFTLVLKGHIGIATACFPKGTRGVDIDALARMPLWQHGKDYAHGTGHGVGSYMNVHEGPQGISKRAMEPFQAGMIVSNEPGFYKEGHYGIRIENLVAVHASDNCDNMLAFETLTLCPIDKRLIDASLMTAQELNWLNQYHEHVEKTLSAHLNEEAALWLKEATKPI